MEQASKRSRLTFYHTSPSRYSSSGRVRRNAKLSAIAKTRLLERIAINLNQLNTPETAVSELSPNAPVSELSISAVCILAVVAMVSRPCALDWCVGAGTGWRRG